MIDPAELIARNWHKGLNLTYNGVDFGECMTYDCLQIINRSILSQRVEDERTKEAGEKQSVPAEAGVVLGEIESQ